MNQFIIVGRIDSIEFKDFICELTLKVRKSFKKKGHEFDVVLISVQVPNNLSDTLKEYCKPNDVIGVKGIIQENNVLMVEKITFIDSN